MVWLEAPLVFLHLLSALVPAGGKILDIFCFQVASRRCSEAEGGLLLAASGWTTLYPFGPSHGDQETPKMDDGSSPEITLSIQFLFFGRLYQSIYVSPPAAGGP